MRDLNQLNGAELGQHRVFSYLLLVQSPYIPIICPVLVALHPHHSPNISELSSLPIASDGTSSPLTIHTSHYFPLHNIAYHSITLQNVA